MNRLFSYLRVMNKKSLAILFGAISFQLFFAGYTVYYFFFTGSTLTSLLLMLLGLILMPVTFLYTLSRLSILNKKKTAKRICNYMNYIVDRAVQ